MSSSFAVNVIVLALGAGLLLRGLVVLVRNRYGIETTPKQLGMLAGSISVLIGGFGMAERFAGGAAACVGLLALHFGVRVLKARGGTAR